MKVFDRLVRIGPLDDQILCFCVGVYSGGGEIYIYTDLPRRLWCRPRVQYVDASDSCSYTHIAVGSHRLPWRSVTVTWRACISSWRPVTIRVCKPLKMGTIAPGFFRHHLTSACFPTKGCISSRSRSVLLSFSPGTCEWCRTRTPSRRPWRDISSKLGL